MVQPLHTVAVLLANPALSSILTSTLAGAPSLRVRAFESETALRTYLHVASAALLVTDLDSGIAERLYVDNARPSGMQVIALATRPTPRPAGIDEIILKPMSPRYLLERVISRLAKARTREPLTRGLNHRDWSTFGDNIVPLFGRSPAPPSPRV